MALTQEQKTAYIKGGGGCCPYCSSKEIEGGFIEAVSDGACQKIQCLTCGRHWCDVHSLVDVEEVEGG